MKEKYSAGVPAAVGAFRKSSRDENTRQTVPNNPNRADCVPPNAGFQKQDNRTVINHNVGIVAQKSHRDAASRMIDSQTGCAENHRQETTVARGSKPEVQAKNERPSTKKGTTSNAQRSY